MYFNTFKINYLCWLSLVAAILLAGCAGDPNERKRGYFDSGEKYYAAGKYQQAMIQFRNAVQVDPRFAAAHWQLARAYAKLSNPNAEYHELAETVSLEPKNSDAQLELAALLLSSREYKEAQAAAEEALKVVPNSARAHAILGEKYRLTNEPAKAVQELRKAVDADPQQVEGYALLGAALVAAGQTAEGEAAYKKGVEANPRSVNAHVSLGQFRLSQRKIAEGEAEMRTAAGLDPYAVLPRLFLARILLATDRRNDAEKLYSELKKVAPDDPQAYQALGLFYLSGGQREKAAAEFQSLLASKPKDAAVKANLIGVLIDLNRMKEARSLNQEVLRKNSQDPQALLANGRMLMAEGKYQEATAALQSAVRSDANCAPCFYFLGGAQAADNHVDEARVSLARARQLAPQMSGATAVLARLDANGGAYDEALQLADSALKANPQMVSAWVTEARALIAKGDLAQAEGKLEEALDRDSANLPAVSTLLGLYTRQGKTQAAVQRISKLVEQDPKSAGLHVLLGEAWFNVKELDKAEANARQALALDPKIEDGYSLLANTDLARGALDQARTHFRAAIDANPTGLSNYMSLELLSEREGNWEEAKNLVEKAHQIDPASPFVANNLAYLYLEHGGDVNVAVSLARMARQKQPASPVTADTLGWAYYKLGSANAAVGELTESVKKVPRNPVYQYHLGMAYLADGRPDLARQSLDRALKSDPRFTDAANARAALDKISRQAQPAVRK